MRKYQPSVLKKVSLSQKRKNVGEMWGPEQREVGVKGRP